MYPIEFISKYYIPFSGIDHKVSNFTQYHHRDKAIAYILPKVTPLFQNNEEVNDIDWHEVLKVRTTKTSSIDDLIKLDKLKMQCIYAW